MSESVLREFVREMLWEAKKKKEEEEGDSDVSDMPSRYGAPGYLPSDVLPYGQDYITDEEQEEREDLADEYDGNLLNYFCGMTPSESRTFNKMIKEAYKSNV